MIVLYEIIAGMDFIAAAFGMVLFSAINLYLRKKNQGFSWPAVLCFPVVLQFVGSANIVLKTTSVEIPIGAIVLFVVYVGFLYFIKSERPLFQFTGWRLSLTAMIGFFAI